MKFNGLALTVFVLLTILMIMSPVFDNVEGQSEGGLPPVAVIKPFPYVKVGDTMVFNGSQSHEADKVDSPGEGIIEWKWFIREERGDWKNQTILGEEEVFSYTVNVPGTFVVNLTVTNSSGSKGWTEKILLVSGPDLQVRSISIWGHQDLFAGDEVKIEIAFENVGTVDINGPWVISITDNGYKIKEDIITGSLSPGETGYYNVSDYTLKEGERSFVVMLDQGEDIHEMAEDNNRMEVMYEFGEEERMSVGISFIFILAILLLIFPIALMVTAGIVIFVILIKRSSKE